MKNLNFIIASCLLLMSSILISPTFGQVNITNSIQLKTACENSPGNIVSIFSSIKVAEPLASSNVITVNTPCTLVITNEQKVELELCNINFLGGLSVQSAGKGEFVSTKSSVKASSVAINLGGEGSQISLSQSLLNATSGNLTITLGRQAKMELYGTYNQSWSLNALAATGALNVSAGERFTGSIADLAVNGLQGININMSGSETLLKLEKVVFRSNNGSIGIGASGTKSLLEGKELYFNFKNKSDILFAGSESTIKFSEVGFFGPSTVLKSLGGVLITAGSGTSGFGKVECENLYTGAMPLGGGLTIKASTAGSSGGVSMSKSNVTTDGPMLFESGDLGNTEVKENRLTSLGSITIKTATTGSCVATPNISVTSPQVFACSPVMAALRLSIYPNPSVSGDLNIKIDETNEPKEVSLISNRGSVVKKWKSAANEEISTTGLAQGSYTVLVIDNKTGQKTSAKFIVE